MKKNPLSKGVLTENGVGIGPVTRAMVDGRAHEIALIAGRRSPQVVQTDYEQAKRELTGESDSDRQDALLDALPDEKRWGPVPGSSGHQTPETPGEGEGSKERSKTEQLVDEGSAETKRDRAPSRLIPS